jgi:predicted DNA-binding transcriptional regulator AlpA
MSLEHAPQRTGVCKGHEGPIERFLTRKQLAEILGVSEQTIWRMTVDGRLDPPIRINSRNLRWPESTVARFRERCSVPEYAGIARAART